MRHVLHIITHALYDELILILEQNLHAPQIRLGSVWCGIYHGTFSLHDYFERN